MRGTRVRMVGRTVAFGRQVLDAAAIDDLRAEAQQEELAGRMLEGVRQRQKGQVDLVCSCSGRIS